MTRVIVDLKLMSHSAPPYDGNARFMRNSAAH